jgi:hypothetical protein
MPRLNYGTLLDNIIVLETTRLCFDRAEPDEATAFASAFAMPPLTECWSNSTGDRNNSPAFTHAFLVQLAAGQNAPQTLQELWSLCMNNAPGLPICRYREAPPGSIRHDAGGPNGALLAAMLAAQRGRTIHIWVNDDGAVR